MLSKLIHRIGLLTLHGHFGDVLVAAPRVVDKLDWTFSDASKQNYFSRKIFLSSIVHGPTKNHDPPKPGKRRTKYTSSYSEEDNKLIVEYVKEFGEGTGTWKGIANVLGNKSWRTIMMHYELQIKTKPTVKGRFSEKEDEIILSFVEKNGKDWKSLMNLTKLLGRGSIKAVWKRHKLLVSDNVLPWKRWEISEEEEILKAVFNIEEIDPSNIASLERIVTSDFEVVSKKLKRPVESCLFHWKLTLHPILKTHIKGLPLTYEWKRELSDFIIKLKIRRVEELDISLVVDQVCPGQTRISIAHYVHQFKNTSMNRKDLAENVKDVPLFEIMEISFNKPGPNNPFRSPKVAEKDLQYKNDIVNLYEKLSWKALPHI